MSKGERAQGPRKLKPAEKCRCITADLHLHAGFCRKLPCQLFLIIFNCQSHPPCFCPCLSQCKVEHGRNRSVGCWRSKLHHSGCASGVGLGRLGKWLGRRESWFSCLQLPAPRHRRGRAGQRSACPGCSWPEQPLGQWAGGCQSQDTARLFVPNMWGGSGTLK